METPTAKQWWDGAKEHEAKGHPGYVKMLQWAQGKCFSNMVEMTAAYERDTNGK